MEHEIAELIAQALWLIVIAALWGGTNPLIKEGGKGIEDIKRDNVISQFFAELHFLMTNWKYMAPFLLNQTGSVLFYVTLATSEISLVVPITNALTFIFTLISAHFSGEKIGSKKTYLGIIFVIIGVFFCVSSKMN